MAQRILTSNNEAILSTDDDVISQSPEVWTVYLPTVGDGSGGTVAAGWAVLIGVDGSGRLDVRDSTGHAVKEVRARRSTRFTAMSSLGSFGWLLSDAPLKYPSTRVIGGGGGGAHAATHQDGGSDEIVVTGLAGLLGSSQTPLAHSHVVADTIGLQTVLDGKADDAHTHLIADTTGLQAALDGKAAASHAHAIADTTGLQAALDAKEAVANKGAASGYAALDAGTKVPTTQLGGAGADSTKFLRGDQAWAAPPGGGGEAFPVGSVFIAVVATNPATLLGYGTWSAFAAGRVLVGIDAGQTEFDVVEETGGAKTHTLVASEMPAHAHVLQRFTGTTGPNVGFTADTSMSTPLANTSLTTLNAGADGAHNNLQPYIVVYMWKRTA